MNKKYFIVIILIYSFQFSIAQTDNTKVDLPFHSYLTKVDTLELIKVMDALLILEFAETINSEYHWQFIGLKITSSADGGIMEQMKKPITHIYVPRNEISLINSKLIFDTFNLDEINKPNYFEGLTLTGILNNSYGWTPFYKDGYLLIKKCEGYVGDQISSNTTYEYYFKKK